MAAPSSKTHKPFTVRFPKPLLQRLRKSAPETGRSLNSEIIFRLLASYAEPQPSKSAD